MPAHSPSVGMPYVGNPLGYQQITPATSTALTVPAGATYAVFCAEGQIVRFRDDGTAPTATVGFNLAVGVPVTYSGNLFAVKAIQSTTGGILNVLYYS